MPTFHITIAHTGEVHVIGQATFDSVSELKDAIFQFTNILPSRQIVLAKQILPNSSDERSSLAYTFAVPKDSHVKNTSGNPILYVFDRNCGLLEEVTSTDVKYLSIEELHGRTEQVQMANAAAWGNYEYHKRNFLKSTQKFSDEFLQYDAEEVKPLIHHFREKMTERSQSISIDSCLAEFLGRSMEISSKGGQQQEFKTLYDLIPVEKVLKWHEMCVQGRDSLCAKYKEVYDFADMLANEKFDNSGVSDLTLSTEEGQKEQYLNAYNAARRNLTQNLSRIKEFQTNIRSSMTMINVLKDAIPQHSKQLRYLKVVLEWSEVFPRVESELKRRAQCNYDLQQKLQQVEECQSNEVAYRQSFLREYRDRCLPILAEVICRMPPPLTSMRTIESLPAYSIESDPKHHSIISYEMSAESTDELTRLRGENARLQEKLREKEQDSQRVLELEHALASSEKISHTSFEVNDIALFMPTGRRARRGDQKLPIYLAFHSNTPHRYLSHDSLPFSTDHSQSPPDYVLGRIVMMEECVSQSAKSNEYMVPNGVRYWTLTVEVLK